MFSSADVWILPKQYFNVVDPLPLEIALEADQLVLEDLRFSDGIIILVILASL